MWCFQCIVGRRRNVCTQNNHKRQKTVDANFASEVCGCDVKRCHSTEVASCSTRVTYAVVPPLYTRVFLLIPYSHCNEKRSEILRLLNRNATTLHDELRQRHP